ncbi:oxidoreductase [Pengzhenrongella frigida]|uniref:Oxidoreductase n=1 Tax=Pengzhenrongella frigida TaxID=1259133 RepID=A0A4Q5MXD4_9MICO|nr:oxidoreductase [Cellulomonas sp. HLT2-17]RYV50289.1 oxidoreductase [Cellulomonas sp. HLT2-17]
MALFFRRQRTSDATAQPSAREAQQATVDHFREFVRTQVGVEAYLEPVTSSTPMTLMLIATSGEWTRRKVPDARAAHSLAHDLGIPIYDVHRTGYPQRMRDWSSRQRILAKRARQARTSPGSQPVRADPGDVGRTGF